MPDSIDISELPRFRRPEISYTVIWESSCRVFVSVIKSHPVFLKPIEHFLPSVRGGDLIVARPVVRVEAVLRFWVDVDLGGIADYCKRGSHFIQRFKRNSTVFPAIKSDYRSFKRPGVIE